jgi:hypothetical protein
LSSLELKIRKMQTLKRAFGCGGSPAYGPIRRDAHIWQAYLYRLDRDWLTGRGLKGRTLTDPLTYIKQYTTYYRSKTKCCGDFDNESSRGFYICYGCIKNEQTKKNFLSQYDKSTQARTD